MNVRATGARLILRKVGFLERRGLGSSPAIIILSCIGEAQPRNNIVHRVCSHMWRPAGTIDYSILGILWKHCMKSWNQIQEIIREWKPINVTATTSENCPTTSKRDSKGLTLLQKPAQIWADEIYIAELQRSGGRRPLRDISELLETQIEALEEAENDIKVWPCLAKFATPPKWNGTRFIIPKGTS